MQSNSEDEFEIKPLPYGTPSPYKKCRPAGLSLKKLLSAENEKMNTRLKEIAKIEEKYMQEIVRNIESLGDETDALTKATVHQLMLDSLLKLTSQAPDVVRNFVNRYESGDGAKVYFNPDNYFNKFNFESLQSSELLKRHPLYGHLSFAEFLELIRLDAMVISQNSSEEKSLITYLLFLGSVTINKTITGRITEILSKSVVNFTDVRAVIENWGKVDQPATPRSLGIPQSHNFAFILDTIRSSVQHYTLDETKELMTFLVRVSLDPLLNGMASSLLRPLIKCFHQLKQFGIEKTEVVDLIYDRSLNSCQFLRVTTLLLNSGIPDEVGIAYGYKVLHQTLSQDLVAADVPININMNALHQVLLNAEHQLSNLDSETLYYTYLLVELISLRMPNREEFDIRLVLDLMENCKPVSNSIYFSDIIARLREMWNKN